MTRAAPTSTTRAASLSDELVQRYQRDGFVHVPNVFSPRDVERFRAAATSAQSSLSSNTTGRQARVFAQLLQVWRHEPAIADLTLDANLAGIATRLAGIPLRLWHDQLLIKPPRNGAATEFHQDGPYWPHSGSRHALSAWVALVDVPVERGCMSFIPGSQLDHLDLRPQDFTESSDLFSVAPDLMWESRVTVPLRAGDCTFHNSYTAHTANANQTDSARIAHVVIYTDRDLTYDGRPHPVTDGIGLEVGSHLPDNVFPRFDSQ